MVIAVVDYGIGNLRSAEKALQRVGADARLESDPDAVADAEGVVLPGVGAFGPCARALHAAGLDKAVRHALETGKAFLGICVGLQLLYEGSEESPGTAGLGVLEGVVGALPPTHKRPQMQWNVLERRGSSAMLSGLDPSPWAYFVHSYAPPHGDGAGVVATCDYGETVVAAVERGRLWGAQFHPEKSGAVGLAMLANFAAVCG